MESAKSKQSKEVICAKACIREHNRLMKMNKCYDTLRDQLNISRSTSKANTLTEAVQYIKMLKHVLEAPQETDGDGEASGGQATEPPTKSLETAQELEQSYTLKDEFRAILPVEKQNMSLSALAVEMPYFMKLLSLTSQPTASDSDSTISAPESYCAVESNKHTAVHDAVPVRMSIESTNEMVIQEEVQHQVHHASDDSVVSTYVFDPECLLASDEGTDIEPVQVAEQMLDTEYSLAAELERNLGEESFEWLERNLPDCDEFFNDDNRLIGLDTEDSLTGLEVLYGFTNH